MADPRIAIYGCFRGGDIGEELLRYVVVERRLHVALIGSNRSHLDRTAAIFEKRKGACVFAWQSVQRSFKEEKKSVSRILRTANISVVVDCSSPPAQGSPVLSACAESGVGYVSLHPGISVRLAAEAEAVTAVRSGCLLLPNVGMHLTCADALVRSLLSNRKSRLDKVKKGAILSVGIHYRIKHLSFGDALGATASSLVAVIDGLRTEPGRRPLVPVSVPRIKARVMTDDNAANAVWKQQRSRIWCNVPAPVSRLVRNENAQLQTCVCVSVDGPLTWGSYFVALLFATLSVPVIVWAIRALPDTAYVWIVNTLQNYRCVAVKRASSSATSKTRTGDIATTSTTAIAWATLRDAGESKVAASAVMVIEGSQAHGLVAATRAAENVVFRLPRRLCGSGARAIKRKGLKRPSDAFGDDFCERLRGIGMKTTPVTLWVRQ